MSHHRTKPANARAAIVARQTQTAEVPLHTVQAGREEADRRAERELAVLEMPSPGQEEEIYQMGAQAYAYAWAEARNANLPARSTLRTDAEGDGEFLAELSLHGLNYFLHTAEHSRRWERARAKPESKKLLVTAKVLQRQMVLLVHGLSAANSEAPTVVQRELLRRAKKVKTAGLDVPHAGITSLPEFERSREARLCVDAWREALHIVLPKAKTQGALAEEALGGLPHDLRRRARIDKARGTLGKKKFLDTVCDPSLGPRDKAFELACWGLGFSNRSSVKRSYEFAQRTERDIKAKR